MRNQERRYTRGIYKKLNQEESENGFFKKNESENKAFGVVFVCRADNA